jgi:hypothetical protein
MAVRKKALLVFFGIGALAAIFYGFYYPYVIYSPVILSKDEADYALKSIWEIINTQTVSGFIKEVFQVHGALVVFGMESIHVATYWLLGHLDLQIYNLVCALFLFFSGLLILFRLHPDIEKWILLSAIFFPFVFSPSHNNCAINTSCTGLHYFGLSLSIFSLYFFTRRGLGYFLLAEFFMLYAIFTLPSSVVLMMLAIIPLYLDCKDKKQSVFKSYPVIFHLFISIAAFSVFLLLTGQESSAIRYPSDPLLWLKWIWVITITYLNLLGSFLYWPSDAISAIPVIVTGSLVLGLGLYMVNRQRKNISDRENLFLVLGILLVLAMAAIISVGRIYTFGSPRYAVYACFCLIFIAATFFYNYRPTTTGSTFRNYYLIALLSILYFVTELYIQWPYVERMSQEIQRCEQGWKINGKACGVMIKHAEATKLLKDAQKKGLIEIELD